ncbi:MAG: universal stress protein [Nitrospirota bacterium]
MLEVRAVLVPVDFSDGSLAALQHAIGCVSPERGTVHLLHVIDPVAGGVGEGQATASRVLARFQDRLAPLAESVSVRGVKAKRHVAVGSVADEILAMAERCRADLIVMGTHGRSGWGHPLLGSTTERVVRRSTRPVLTVKERRSAARADVYSGVGVSAVP